MGDKRAPQNLQQRTVRAWVITNATGWPFVETVCPKRRQTIAAYNLNGAGWSTYKEDRRKYGVQAVRCTITTAP